MPIPVRLSYVSNEGLDPLLSVEEGPITIGREKDSVLALERAGVSRRHASILQANNYWLLVDFGSSNGSWLNGEKLQPAYLRLLKNGDTLQFADCPILYEEMEARPPAEDPGEVSLLVFYKSSFHAEVKISQITESFRLGGENADMAVEGLAIDRVIFELSSTASGAVLSLGDSPAEVLCNREEVQSATLLEHGDEILVAPYRFIVAVNSPPVETVEKESTPSTSRASRKTTMLSAADVAALTAEYRAGADDDMDSPFQDPEAEDGWVSESAKRKQGFGQPMVFGTAPEGVALAQTQSLPKIDPTASSSASYDMSSSQKFSQANEEVDGYDQNEKQEKVLILVGAFIFIALISFMLYVFGSALL